MTAAAARSSGSPPARPPPGGGVHEPRRRCSSCGATTQQLAVVEVAKSPRVQSRKQASSQSARDFRERVAGARAERATTKRKRSLRVDEDDVGVALHVLGEEGAAGAAANHHHPRLLPRPRHRRSRTRSPPSRPTQLTTPAHAALLTKLADRR